MKWGVRKTYYKSLDRKQKKKVRKDYYKTPEGRLRKSVMIGTLIAGPLGGFIGSSIANKKK